MDHRRTQPPFAIAVEHFGDTAVISLTGELDTTRTPQLDETLDTCLSQDHIHLIMNVTDLTFCDSMGLRTILEFVTRSARAGGWLRLVGAQGVLKRLLEVTGVAGVIPMDPDIETAMRARFRDGTHGP